MVIVRAGTHVEQPQFPVQLAKVDVIMSRKIRWLYATCLVLRGLLAPLAEGFRFPLPSGLASSAHGTPGRVGGCGGGGDLSRSSNHCSVTNWGSLVEHHEHVRQRDVGRCDPKARNLGAQQEDADNVKIREDAVKVESDASIVSAAIGGAAASGGGAIQAVRTSLFSSMVMLACTLLFFVSGPIGPFASVAHANSADSTIEIQSPTPTLEEQDLVPVAQPQIFEQKSPARTVVRRPPPRVEIPPGRITITQWVSRALAHVTVRYLPRSVDLHAATVPALADFASIAEEAKRDLSGSVDDAVKSGKGLGSGGEMLSGGVGGGRRVTVSAVKEIACRISDCWSRSTTASLQ